MNKEEKINKLNRFKYYVEVWGSRSNSSKEARSFIRENMDWVQREVNNAGCYCALTIGPPPAVGGLVMRNVNPFLMLFNPPYGISMVSHIVDMIERTIGIIKCNGEIKVNLSGECMIADRVKDEFIGKLLSIKRATEFHNEYRSSDSAVPINEAVEDLRVFINVNRGIVRNFSGVDK
ncbi:MAG: hypothetical protein HQL64_17545, partial [Magnetococcales bacterium]|nr:hypothetical protein [Magnetococcales bacterium]